MDTPLTNRARAEEIVANSMWDQDDFVKSRVPIDTIAKALDEAEQRGRESQEEPSEEEIKAIAEEHLNVNSNSPLCSAWRYGARWALAWRKEKSK